MSRHYHDESRAEDPYYLPTIEIFYLNINEVGDYFTDDLENEDLNDYVGYYYWFCLPGCMPDSEPFGPFETEELALEDARSDLEFGE